MVKNGQGEEPVFPPRLQQSSSIHGRICITQTSTNTTHSLSSQVKNMLFSIQEQSGLQRSRAELPRPGVPAGTHRLHQDIVLAVQERGSGILVQGLHVVPGRQGWPVIHAATGVSLLNLQETHPQCEVSTGTLWLPKSFS